MLEHCLERSDEDYDKGLEITSRILNSIWNVTIEGKENFEDAKNRTKGLIVLARHPGNVITRYVDIVATGYFLEKALDSRGYYVAKDSIDTMLKKIKPIAKLFGINNTDRLGQIPVHRKKDKKGSDLVTANIMNKKAYKAVAELYGIGEKIVICPEGGSTSGKPFNPKESVLKNVTQIRTSEDPFYLPLNIQYSGRNLILSAGPLIQTRDVDILYAHLMKSMK